MMTQTSAVSPIAAHGTRRVGGEAKRPAGSDAPASRPGFPFRPGFPAPQARRGPRSRPREAIGQMFVGTLPVGPPELRNVRA